MADDLTAWVMRNVVDLLGVVSLGQVEARVRGLGDRHPDLAIAVALLRVRHLIDRRGEGASDSLSADTPALTLFDAPA